MGVNYLLNSASPLPSCHHRPNTHCRLQPNLSGRSSALSYYLIIANIGIAPLLSTILVAPSLICPCNSATSPYLRIVSNSHFYFVRVSSRLPYSCCYRRLEGSRQLPRFVRGVPVLQAKASSDQFPLQAIDKNLAHERHITQLGCA